MKIFEILSCHSDYVKPTLASHPLIVSNEMLGLEIELENVSSRLRSLYWVEKADGSLRNQGREFVFRGPLGGVDLFKALTEAGRHFHEIQPAATWRCSTHVHMDVRDMNVNELKNLILLYTIYEEVLYTCSGYNRYKNNFGPAFGFAQSQITKLSRAWGLSGGHFIDNILGCWSKYSSLNLLPIGRFGSVEFRIANALTTTGDLIRLCNRFLLLKEWALGWKGSQEELIKHHASLQEPAMFNSKLTGLKAGDINQELVIKGAILANDIIHLETKRRENSVVAGMLRTSLSPSRMRTLISIASEGADRSSAMAEMREWLSETFNNEAYREIPLEKGQDIIRLFGVSRSWLAHPDNIHLLNA